MPLRSDTSAGLTEAQICEINGVSQSLRQSWVDRGLLRKAPQRGCSLADALALAALRTLFSALGPNDGTICWRELQSELAGVEVDSRLDAVFDAQYKKADLATDGPGLRQLVAHGRPVRVIPLADLRRDVRSAFERLAHETRRPAKRRPSARQR